jgi:hypothetical protein
VAPVFVPLTFSPETGLALIFLWPNYRGKITRATNPVNRQLKVASRAGAKLPSLALLVSANPLSRKASQLHPLKKMA